VRDGDYRIGNQNPKRRGLDKNIKNAKRAKRKSGCPLSVILYLGVGSLIAVLGDHVLHLFL
jgi:hypothetical protein